MFGAATNGFDFLMLYCFSLKQLKINTTPQAPNGPKIYKISIYANNRRNR